MRPDHEIDPGRNHRRGVDQRRHRRGAGHRVGQPHVERDLGALADRPREQEQCDRRRCVFRQHRSGPAEHRLEIQRAEPEDDQRQPDQHQRVADPRRDERLLGRLRVGRYLRPEPDQQVRAQPHALPPEVQHEVVGSEDEHQHEEHEQVHVGEEAPVPRIASHVADGIDVDQRADPRDDEDHRRADAVHPQIHAHDEPPDRDPVDEVLEEQPIVRGFGDELRHDRQRHGERDDHRRRCEPASPPTQAPAPEEVDRRGRQRQRRDQPERRVRVAHHRSSRTSSTSTLRRRR